jgi:hypothetical protein
MKRSERHAELSAIRNVLDFVNDAGQYQLLAKDLLTASYALLFIRILSQLRNASVNKEKARWSFL